MKRILQAFTAALAVVFLVVNISAQDFRATISGLVTDPSGATVPGALVRAINLETNETKEAKTTSDGHYTIPYLAPGTYNLEVTANGFQTLRRESIVLRVADKLNLPLQLTVGNVSEAVTVVGQQEVTESGSADRGLVFDPVKTQELPLNGRQTYMLLSLTPGVIFTQETFGNTGFSGTRGWDVNNAYRINGARQGQNLFLLNGAPISTRDGTWEVAPNIEAVEEFKVMTNTYDAQYGRFGGGVVNTTLKSGTKDWHGDVFEYFRNKIFDANTFQNNLIGAPKTKHNQHQWGGVAGGPIRKDKDFIFGSFEGWRERIGFPAVTSVPPLGLRQVQADGVHFGDLKYNIYDPFTTHQCGTKPGETAAFCTVNGARRTFVRDPFPNNVIPTSRLSPIGQKILSYYPAPNVAYSPGPPVTGLNNNFVAAGNVGRYTYNQPMVRWDHVVSEKDRFYVLFTYQHGQEYRDQTGFGPPAGSGDVGSQRTDQNYILSWTRVLSPTSVLDVRGSFGRLTAFFPRYTDFSLTADKLGMTQLIHAPTFQQNTVPQITVGGYTQLFATAGTVFSWNTDNQWNLTPSLTLTRGRHAIRTGFEFHYYTRGADSPGWSNGTFGFGTGWTQQFPDVQQNQFDGSGVASLLLGTPTGGQIDWNASSYRTRPYYAVYVQDDWKVSPRLTLNLGLRYDVQLAWLERFDRVTRGFDVTTKNPLSDQILANWAKVKATYDAANPTTKYPYPAPPAALVGGYLFPGVNGQPRRQYDTDWTNIQPRIGVAWRIAEKTVLRAGAGIYYNTPTQLGVVAGFSQTTPFTTSLDGLTPSAGLTGPYSLVNPFPNGLATPFGSSLGLLTNVGNGLSFDPPRYRLPRTYQYSFGFQHELPHHILAEVSFAGNYQNHIEIGYNQNRWSLADNTIGFGDNTYLNRNLPNPFFGILPITSGFGGSATISAQNLLRPDPVFSDVTNNLVQQGHYRSDALQVKVEKRLLGGSTAGVLTFGVSYTFAKAYEQNHRLNNWNTAEPLIYEIDNQDKPQNLAVYGVWDLPFGRNRRFDLSNSVANTIAGNWRFDWILTYVSGYPVGWPNLQNKCDTWKATTQDENHWFNNDKTCYANFPSFFVRTIPDRFPDIRNPAKPQLNVALEKTFPLNERFRLQFRGEAFNVTNTPIRPGPDTGFTSPTFGQLPKSQNNFPRVIQLAAKLYF